MMTGWLETAVVYQLYPRSFADANGDGMATSRVSLAPQNTCGNRESMLFG